jgi:hypothetical protein
MRDEQYSRARDLTCQAMMSAIDRIQRLTRSRKMATNLSASDMCNTTESHHCGFFITFRQIWQTGSFLSFRSRSTGRTTILVGRATQSNVTVSVWESGQRALFFSGCTILFQSPATLTISVSRPFMGMHTLGSRRRLRDNVVTLPHLVSQIIHESHPCLSYYPSGI